MSRIARPTTGTSTAQRTEDRLRELDRKTSAVAAAASSATFARYEKSAAQSAIAAGTLTAVAFDVEVKPCPLVVPNAAGTVFTLQPGVWDIQAGVRVTGGPMGAALWEAFAVLAAAAADNTVRYDAADVYPALVGSTAAVKLGTSIRLDDIGTIAVNAVGNNTSGSGGTFSLTGVSGQAHIAFSYRGA